MPAGAVRRQVDHDRPVDVRPLGVVVHALRDERRARHEPERLDEAREPQLSVQLAVDDRPRRVAREVRLERLSGDRSRAHVGEIPVCVLEVLMEASSLVV